MATDLEIFDNKIIVLYILDKNSRPLTIDQIAKFCEEFEDITYFDICAYIEDLKNSNYITESLQNNQLLYEITENGTLVLKELLELIPGVNLYNIKKIIDKNMVKIKTDYAIDTVIIPIKSEEFKISCYIKDGNDELINITMYAGNKAQAKNISKNWNRNAETIYTKLLEMMTKEENEN